MKIGVGGAGEPITRQLRQHGVTVPIHDTIYRALQLRDGATPAVPC